MNIGIMSGRLSKQIDKEIQAFPFQEWQKEFENAKNCGFSSIEWIFDLKPNPISNEKGINEMNDLMEKTKVMVNSVCCDYFMKKQLFGDNTTEIEQSCKVLKKIIKAVFPVYLIRKISPPIRFLVNSSNEHDKNESA